MSDSNEQDNYKMLFYKDKTTSPHVNEKTEEYLQYFDSSQTILRKRADSYKEVANHYYDLVTDFYEYGWGQSFHFGYPVKGESYEMSIRRLEHYLAFRLGIKKGQHVLDIGCGIGGPMRSFARFSGAKVTGLNNNSYQIKKGEKYNKALDLSSLCSFVKADFMERFPFEDNTFDGIYSLEALCYAPNPTKVYAEILRVLKPGALIVGTDWCMTPSYDPNNPLHVQIKKGIELGDGLEDLLPSSTLVESLQKAGLELIELRDLATESYSPWYGPLESKWSLKGFRRTGFGRFATTQMARALELFTVAPRGTTKVTQFLNEGADSLVKGGQLGIFTPGLFFVAKKPI